MKLWKNMWDAVLNTEIEIPWTEAIPVGVEAGIYQH